MFSTILTSIGLVTFSLQGQQTNGYPIIGVPEGAILPYNGISCPEGYILRSDLAGFTIVGAGLYNGTNNVGTYESRSFPFNGTGGTLTEQLTIDQMPNHTHTNGEFNQLSRIVGDYTNVDYDLDPAQPDLKNTGSMLYQGGDQAHNNMPPHKNYNYCEKITNDNTTGLVDTNYFDQIIQPINSNLTTLAGGLYNANQDIGNHTQRINTLEQNNDDINQRLNTVEQNGNVTNQRLNIMEQNSNATNQRLNLVEQNSNGTNHRLNSVEQNGYDNSQQINLINQNITSISEEVHDLNQRLANISNTEIIITDGVNGTALYTKEQGEAVQNRVDNINISVSALMSIIAEQGGYIENLETELNNTKEELAQANQRINGIIDQLENSGADPSVIAAWTLAATMTAITLAVCIGCLCKMQREKIAQQQQYGNHHQMRVQSISSYHPHHKSNSIAIQQSQQQSQYNMNERRSSNKNSIIEMNQRNKSKITFGGGNNSALNDNDMIAISELENVGQWSNKKFSKNDKKDEFLNNISSHDVGMDMVQNEIFDEMNDENHPVGFNDDKEGIVISNKLSTNSKVYNTPNNPSIFGSQNQMNQFIDDNELINEINDEIIINDDDLHTAGNDNIVMPENLSIDMDDETLQLQNQITPQ